jgi:hypothetical protein
VLVFCYVGILGIGVLGVGVFGLTPLAMKRHFMSYYMNLYF